MDLLDILLQTGLFTGILVVYLIVFKKYPKKRGHYAQRSWNYPLKYLCARLAVRRWKARLPAKRPEYEELAIRAAATDGATLLLGLRKDRAKAELSLFVKLADGTTFSLPRHPDTLVGAWQSVDGSLRAGGLIVQTIGSGKLRILYNGLLKRGGEATEQHVVFSFIWTDGSPTVRHPEDWSDRLAAQALATERWVDSRWQGLLEQCEDSSATSWGCVQGQIQAFDTEGSVQRSEWLRLRGAKVDALKSEVEPRRAVELVVMARDGTMVQLKAASYRGLTQVRSGNVRLPNSNVHSIASTDFRLIDFPENIEGVPSAFVINVSTADRTLRLLVRPATPASGRLLGGAPYSRETHYLTVGGSIDGYLATGLLLITGEPSESGEPRVPVAPPPSLRFITAAEAKDVGYCVALDNPAAACEQLSGGKGASLALLSSVQKQYGFRVPPGFTLTTSALDRHLQANPEIAAAIRDIEVCNEHYKEEVFKDKCNRAVKLFESTEVVADVMEEVRQQLEDLIRKANQQNLGTDLRFAVRSSAVGEDGEALSAAGQNTTVLGCAAEDVLRAIRTCWASMFAFTSANYRRINGQKCRCDGAVVVQAIVKARIAGVLFTRHPDNGDPTRMLITASYGLGESVVSGAVEPDTFIVRRSEDTSSSDLRLVSTQLGSKRSRVEADGSVAEVPEVERGQASLGEAEVLRLARVALALERAWAAPRDIEWAVCEKDLFLLQARPITSLQRWSELELLHEHDTPIMSDDTLVSFANVGEVLPKPVSPLSQDIVTKFLVESLHYAIGAAGANKFITTCGFTHYRAYMDVYNVSYRNPPVKVDMSLRMMEMAIHGHGVADEHILSVARHINEQSVWEKLNQLLFIIKSLLFSKWVARDSIKINKKNHIDKFTSDDPSTMLSAITGSSPKLAACLVNHMITSAASSVSQIIAMAILLEGAQDFTAEHCSEIGTMLSSGETVSEVPQALDRLARALAQSGRAEQFRAQAPEQALTWLEDNLPELHAAVQKFLEQHGHRALMEFDVATKPWALQPEQLMKVLQNTPPPPPGAEEPRTRSDAEIIAGLTTPKKSSTRKFLSWVLPLCRRMVVNRELTKDQLILSIHKLRLALRQMGPLLVRDWLLPDVELLFFFRLDELRTYMRTRDPVLLRKATQRRQFWPAWGQLKFAELNTGWPQPLTRAAPRLKGAGARLMATPVCGGSGDVVARAAVIKDLADIGELQQGDILITHSTDIGWSPYFPLITGIVTELGGLISHGAVIAREYGLPCVVGAAGATDLFQTGDLVRLSGATGLVEKVEKADDIGETNVKVDA